MLSQSFASGHSDYSSDYFLGFWPLDQNSAGVITEKSILVGNTKTIIFYNLAIFLSTVNMVKYKTWSHSQFQGQETKFSSVFLKDVSFHLGKNPDLFRTYNFGKKDFGTNFQYFQDMIYLTLVNKKFTLKLTAVYNVAHYCQ